MEFLQENIDAVMIVIAAVVFFVRTKGTIDKIDDALDSVTETLEKLDGAHTDTREQFREEHSKTRSNVWQARKECATEHKEIIAALVEIRTGLQAFINSQRK